MSAYARISTVTVRKESVDEMIAIFRDSVIPAARQQKGLLRMVLGVDRAAGDGVSIALWETKADLTASETSGYLAAQYAKFGPHFTAPPTREVFEVAFRIPISGNPKAMRQIVTQCAPDKIEEFIDKFASSIDGTAKNVDGFTAGVLLVDRGTGKVMSFTAWTTADALKASESVMRSTLAPMFVNLIGVPVVRQFELAVVS